LAGYIISLPAEPGGIAVAGIMDGAPEAIEGDLNEQDVGVG
jgi:hypothetical protein